MDEEIAKQILRPYLENIFTLADEAYQERVWVRWEGPECCGIEERIGDFFENGDSIFKTPERFHFTEHQFELLLKLRKKLDNFNVFRFGCPYRTAKQLISSLEWQEVRDLSKEVLKAFNFKKTPIMDEETVKRVFETFLQKLLCLSDESYQERIWINHEGPESEDIDDLINYFFVEGNIIFDSYQFRLHYLQLGRLVKLRQKLRDFNVLRAAEPYRKSTKELIALFQWQEIRDLAKEILKEFNFTKD